MDSFELMLAIAFMAIMFAVTPQGRDMLRGLNKNDRVTKSSVNANNNVRITNDYNGVTYKPISILPVNDNEFTLEVETIERPHRVAILTVTTAQFKHDVLKTLEEGNIHYRLTQRELVDDNFGISDEVPKEQKPNYDEKVDSKYTEKELALIASVDINERTIMEGEIMNLKASRVSEVNNIIENTAKLSTSKYQGGK